MVETLTVPTEDRAERITRGNGAIERLINSVTALGDSTLDDDRPAQDWLDDWRALAA